MKPMIEQSMIAVGAAIVFAALLASPLLAQTPSAGSETSKSSTTAPSDRTSQSGLQPSTQKVKEPKQTGSTARNNRQAEKKVDEQHK